MSPPFRTAFSCCACRLSRRAQLSAIVYTVRRDTHGAPPCVVQRCVRRPRAQGASVSVERVGGEDGREGEPDLSFGSDMLTPYSFCMSCVGITIVLRERLHRREHACPMPHAVQCSCYMSAPESRQSFDGATKLKSTRRPTADATQRTADRHSSWWH